MNGSCSTKYMVQNGRNFSFDPALEEWGTVPFFMAFILYLYVDQPLLMHAYAVRW